MTDAFAFPGAGPLRPDATACSRTTGAAGSQLHEAWAASLARAAYAERRRARRAAEREYRFVAAATFPVFLAVAAGARLLPPKLRPGLCGAGHRSVLGDAKAMAAATIPIAFMA